MKFLVLIVLVLASAKASDDCDGKQLINCYIEYFSNFLLPTIPTPPTYSDFSRLYLETQSRGGWDAQEQLCGIQETLIQCMANNRGCLTTPNYQTFLNWNEADARSYQTDFKVKEYECGAGRNAFQNIFFCYLKVLHYYQYELNMCNNFQDQAMDGRGYNCSKACDYVDCMSVVYGRRCGTAVKPFICNIAKITIRSNMGSSECDMILPKC